MLADAGRWNAGGHDPQELEWHKLEGLGTETSREVVGLQLVATPTATSRAVTHNYMKILTWLLAYVCPEAREKESPAGTTCTGYCVFSVSRKRHTMTATDGMCVTNDVGHWPGRSTATGCENLTGVYAYDAGTEHGPTRPRTSVTD